MIHRDNLRVSRLRAGGPHFRLSAAVSPDRSLRYQITKLLKLYGTHRFFFSPIFFSPILPNSAGVNLSPMELRISGVNQKPESARPYNLRVELEGKKNSTFLKSPLEENQQVEIQLVRGGC